MILITKIFLAGRSRWCPQGDNFFDVMNGTKELLQRWGQGERTQRRHDEAPRSSKNRKSLLLLCLTWQKKKKIQMIPEPDKKQELWSQQKGHSTTSEIVRRRIELLPRTRRKIKNNLNTKTVRWLLINNLVCLWLLFPFRQQFHSYCQGLAGR